MIRMAYMLAGLALTALGIIGAFVPLMPTTIFLILAAWCFSKSSPRLENWLLNHKLLGPTIVNWRRDGVVPRRAKVLACTSMAVGFLIFLWSAHPAPWLIGVVAVALGLCAWYVLSRPSVPRGLD